MIYDIDIRYGASKPTTAAGKLRQHTYTTPVGSHCGTVVGTKYNLTTLYGQWSVGVWCRSPALASLIYLSVIKNLATFSQLSTVLKVFENFRRNFRKLPQLISEVKTSNH